jgi:hypothetical protein
MKNSLLAIALAAAVMPLTFAQTAPTTPTNPPAKETPKNSKKTAKKGKKAPKKTEGGAAASHSR